MTIKTISEEQSFDIAALRTLYAERKASIPEIALLTWERSQRQEHSEACIYQVPLETLLTEARKQQALLENHSDALTRWPLLGIPFAVKDNIDVVGTPTTAACPEFMHEAEESATIVKKLLDAGALFIGKTNMDQFATGLVGTRSPYGACKNPFDARYITGGSSSGSALAVATGMVSFSLGTDTAGSGRVPAAFNNIVGVKPTRGLLSTHGVIPACPSLDCISIFALNAEDAAQVLEVAKGFDAADPYSRPSTLRQAQGGASSGTGRNQNPLVDEKFFRFGVPKAGQLDFSGDAAYAELFEKSKETLRARGGVDVEIDISPFLRAALLLYQGPWLAERAEAIGRFIPTDSQALMPLLREILAPAKSITGIDAFKGMRALEALKQEALPLWDAMDVLLLPTVPTIFTHEQIAQQPLALNAILGRYTNFVNLMDLCALSVPAGFRPDGLPFGVSLIAQAFRDAFLFSIVNGESAMGRGSHKGGPDPSSTSLLVFGLHMSDQPLNHELTALGGRLERVARTAPRYKMALVKRGEKRLPGIWRQPEGSGVSLEGEIWSLPNESIGPFFTKVLPPLCLGSLELEDGSWVKGFLAEAVVCESLEDISRFGGWRGWLGAI